MRVMTVSRKFRQRQLQNLLQTQQGQTEVQRLFAACFPPGVVPPAGSLMIETILNHEFVAQATE